MKAFKWYAPMMLFVYNCFHKMKLSTFSRFQLCQEENIIARLGLQVFPFCLFSAGTFARLKRLEGFGTPYVLNQINKHVYANTVRHFYLYIYKI